MILLSTNINSFDLKSLLLITKQVLNKDISLHDNIRPPTYVALDELKSCAEKHIHFTFMLPSTWEDTVEVMEMFHRFKTTVLSGAVRDFFIVSGTLEDWVDVIIKENNETANITTSRIFSKIEDKIESYGLQHLFNGYIKVKSEDAYYLERN